MKWVLSLEKNVHRFPPAAYWMKSKFLMLKHHHDWNIIFLFSSSPARPCVLSRVRLFCDPMDCSPLVSSSWGFPGKNTRVGCHFILQGILQIQGWNLHLLHWQVDSLPLCYLGSPHPTLDLSQKAKKWHLILPYHSPAWPAHHPPGTLGWHACAWACSVPFFNLTVALEFRISKPLLW